MLENVGVSVVPPAIVGVAAPVPPFLTHTVEATVPSESVAVAPEMTTELVGKVIARSTPALAVGAALTGGAEQERLDCVTVPFEQESVTLPVLPFVLDMVDAEPLVIVE